MAGVREVGSNDGLPQHIPQDGTALIDLFLADRQGGQQAYDMSMRCINQEVPPQAFRDQIRRIKGQVETDHGALDADLADRPGQLGAERLELAAEPFADGAAAFEEALFLDGL